MLKKKTVICLLLICSLVLPVIPVTADVALPDVNTIWVDKVSFPCAFTAHKADVYYLVLCQRPNFYHSGSPVIYYYGPYEVYKLDGGSWIYLNGASETTSFVLRASLIWTSADFYDQNGDLYLAGTSPVPDVVNNIQLYDYATGIELTAYTVTSPCIITATATSIEITDYSTAELLYSYIWTGSDYFAGFSIGSQDYLEYEIGESFDCSSAENPILLYLYSNQYPVLDGVWQANDSIKGSAAFSSDLNFSVGDVRYTGINYQFSGSVKTLSYLHSSGQETVYVDQWYGNSKKAIDLGPTSQIVSAEFYSWFTSNFTRTGDSEASNIDVGLVQIFDYGSGAFVQLLKLPVPHIIYATAIGIQIEGYSTVETLFSYTWSGIGDFAGFSTLSRDWVEYEVGSNFVNLSSDVTLYLYGDGDTEGPIDPDEPDPTDPTEPDATDPTEPGDSPSTEPTVDPLDKEKDEINGSGNSALDDLTQAVPDYSQDFIAALGDLVRAFSYEGTNCELVIPALVLPGVDGLIPETELLPVTTVDFAEAFLIFPEKVVIVVRSLLTAALIVYCFKELYDTISYFLTLKRGDSNG